MFGTQESCLAGGMDTGMIMRSQIACHLRRRRSRLADRKDLLGNCRRMKLDKPTEEFRAKWSKLAVSYLRFAIVVLQHQSSSS